MYTNIWLLTGHITLSPVCSLQYLCVYFELTDDVITYIPSSQKMYINRLYVHVYFVLTDNISRLFRLDRECYQVCSSLFCILTEYVIICVFTFISLGRECYYLCVRQGMFALTGAPITTSHLEIFTSVHLIILEVPFAIAH